MNIREIRAMRGPNYWSIRRHKLIVMTLDLQEYEQRPTNKIDGFLDRLRTMFPGMYEHRCSVGCAGGFFQRVEEGTWMGHVIEHIALEIQSLAGMEVGFGRTRGFGEEGVYSVVFSYLEEKAGRYAAKAAVNIAIALSLNEKYDLENDIQAMREIRESERLGPSTGSIIEEAVSRGIPWLRLNKYSLCQLGYGVNQKRIQATVSSTTSSIGVEVACDKEDTKHLLEQANIQVAKGDIVKTERQLESAVKYVGYPLVIKPINGNHGRGITININNWEDALEAYKIAKEISRSVIVERFVVGDDYRLLVINYKLVAAAKRTPAHVVGNGQDSIQTLIDSVNEDSRRGYGHENVLTMIKVNEMSENILNAKDYTLDTVLSKDEILHLKDTANLSTGGTATDVTEIVHPENIFMAERISKVIGLDICGIDVMTTDISKPLKNTDGAILEVNAGPGFRMHLAPTDGMPRNVASPVIDMMYPMGSTSRIPIVAVTGTNGKTTTTRLIAHMVKMMGHKVGYTTSDGIYIQNHMLDRGDCTGPVSAEFVLKDPTVDFAILETARGGLLRAGLGFHYCDIAIVTNIAPDHLGLRGINTVEQMARLKGVVPETVLPEGYAILNADDELVYNMRKNLKCNVALFSMDENNVYIKEHAKQNGLAAIYENGFITICKGTWKMRVVNTVHVPLTFGGKARFMIQNVLPAALTGYIRGFDLRDIKMALESFIPSPAQTPGRLNLFEFNKFNVLLDYAHNPAGMTALFKFTENLDGSPKIGIIAGIGDRRDEDNIEMGRLASQMFDEVIIRQDKNLRGKTEKELIGLLTEGIKSHDTHKKITVFKTEKEAITHAIENAVEGSLIVMCSDVVPDALKQVLEYKEMEENKLYEFSKADIPNQ